MAQQEARQAGSQQSGEHKTTAQLKAELLPPVTPLDAPFWDGLREGELRLQQCAACQSFQYPPETFCYACGSTKVEWKRASGRGTVYSFITVHQRFHAAFTDEMPYNVSIVELEEGPRVVSNVIGIPPHDVTVGMAVKASPRPVTEEQSALYFERSGASDGTGNHARP